MEQAGRDVRPAFVSIAGLLETYASVRGVVEPLEAAS